MYKAKALVILVGALINLKGPGNYVNWGIIQISLSNLILVFLMIVVLALAIIVPFPHRSGGKR